MNLSLNHKEFYFPNKQHPFALLYLWIVCVAHWLLLLRRPSCNTTVPAVCAPIPHHRTYYCILRTVTYTTVSSSILFSIRPGSAERQNLCLIQLGITNVLGGVKYKNFAFWMPKIQQEKTCLSYEKLVFFYICVHKYIHTYMYVCICMYVY